MLDGAGRLQRILHVTIPGLLPTYFVLLIMSLGNFFNTGMEQYFVFQNAMNKEYIQVLDLYVYNQGIGTDLYLNPRAYTLDPHPKEYLRTECPYLSNNIIYFTEQGTDRIRVIY